MNNLNTLYGPSFYIYFFLSEEGPWCDVQGVPSFTGVINSISFTLCGG